MPKRFEPNRRLLTILVGSNLYGSPDACIRELIQNSWDAIELRKSDGDGEGGSIEVHYSVRDRWFEVIDDGIGMDWNTVENSFFEIGRDKLEVLEQGTRETQIGYFGIGILSIFMVAEKFQVATRALKPEAEGIRLEVTGIDDDLVVLDGSVDEIGTRIKVFVREGALDLASIPEHVSNYVRHVKGVTVVSTDEGKRSSVASRWVTDGSREVQEIRDLSGVFEGRFTINQSLRSHVGTLSSEATICNAGFLAETSALDLIPHPALGMICEVSLVPNALTVGMSRERIQRDERWTRLGEELQAIFVDFAIQELREGTMRARRSEVDSAETKRTLLLWWHYIPDQEPFLEFRSLIQARIIETVPFRVADRADATIATMLSSAKNSEKLFYRDVGRSARLTENIDDEGFSIRVTQEIRHSLRVGALRANGFDVIELDIIQVNLRNGGSVQTFQVDEHELVRTCLGPRGVPLINIAEATESDMDLTSIERLPLLKDALSIGDGLRFASVPDSERRVITDSTGIKYINLRNEDIREILGVVPRAISNPLKNRLLDAYLQIENYQFHGARKILRELLVADDLSAMAGAETAPFTERHIEGLIAELLFESNQ